MTTSTPPAWHWRDECYVPVPTPEPPDSATLGKQNGGEEALSEDPCNLSVPATLSKQNDSDQCDECRCAPDRPHNAECDGAAKLTDSVTCADERRTKSPADAPNDNPAGCDVSSGPVISCDRKHDNRHDGEPLLRATEPETALLRVTAPEATAPADSCVESCPECGTVTDIEYRDAGQKPAATEEESLQNPAKTADRMADTFSVPFPVQSWTFEALIELEVDRLHEIIDDHHDEIVEMARKRHREGFVTHGSGMYAWSPERRLDETLQELADAGVYPTSGPLA